MNPEPSVRDTIPSPSGARSRCPDHAIAHQNAGRARARWAIAAGVPVAALAVAAWDPARNGGPPLCPVRICTGVACPGCGLTRAVGALLRGRVGDAVAIHPLVVLLVAQVVVLWAVVALVPAARRPQPGRALPLILTLDALAFVGVWAARLASGDLSA